MRVDHACALTSAVDFDTLGVMSTAAPLRVMSFNVRCEQPGDVEDRWDDRKALLVETIHAFDPDLLGTQEVFARQGDYLREQLAGHGFVGVGREDGVRAGEFAAIFYRRDRFDLLDSGTFWLSETPDIAGSKGWDADWMRIVTWARLADRRTGLGMGQGTGQALVHFNTHWDHMGVRARLESARLMRRQIAALGGDAPTIVTGDFNCTEADPPYAALVHDALADAYRAAHPTPRPDESSFHGFKGGVDGKRIDWILHSPAFRVLDATIDRSASANGKFPSDHFAVTATLDR